MNHEIMVSFCIATFQRYEILKELILEILSVDSDRIEVVVCDDCSMDNSINKIKRIHDKRLKVYTNDTNVGSLQNIYESLEHGKGKFLFYVNDRDNVDPMKIKKLIRILEELQYSNVAFLQCIPDIQPHMNYHIYHKGEDALLAFGCRITHPTGCIFRKDAWEKITDRKKIFAEQCYGDYSITLVYAAMAQKYDGAIILGDICDTTRMRVDFSKEKSGYYKKRKDKRLWYSWGVQWRELMIAYRFLKKLKVEDTVIDKMLGKRYKEYLRRVTVEYKDNVSTPYNTLHYGIPIPQNRIKIYSTAIMNGFCLWRMMQCFCRKEGKKELLKKVNQDTGRNYFELLKISYEKILKAI